MDSLSRLPSLVLTNIIIHIESERDILQMIRASPVLFAQYVRYRRTIMRHRLSNILAIDSDGTILQDAQAIIHFPPVNESAPMPLSSVPAICQTLNLWDDQAFSNPLTQSDQGDITKLYRFFCRLITFIEDYLAKALDPFPSRAYLALPDLTSVVPTMHFKGRAVDVKPVPFGTMKGPEKCCLLRAFVRYELLCKVYHPRVWNHIDGSTYAKIVKRSHERLTLKDYEALCCVYEYFKGLYGAVFAHCRDSWLPDRPTHSQSKTTAVNQSVGVEHQYPLLSKDYGLLYPDSVYFSAQEYSIGEICGSLEDILPSLGLDLLSSIVMSLGMDEKNGEYLRVWFGILSSQHDWLIEHDWFIKPWIFRRHFVGRHKHLNINDQQIFLWRLRMASQQQSYRGRGGRICPRGSRIDIEQRTRQFHIHNLQLKIFRQRAWVFFDGSRLCTRYSPHLPTWSELEAEDQTTSEMLGLAYQRARRRSQKWQDYWSGRTLDHPFDQQEGNGSGAAGPVEDNRQCVPRFFEKPGRGEMVKCWKRCDS
ncbi:hypothetical protein NM208_g6249 [Fusarium decemcellulare]|uniref:Uncharacterized protein n=1 Tax=Fusarium decemcellulare TaxID=57161 RepID=A0ACC1SDW1_9HYPO|nr:hypothetical protein NM208_g6249 [Fusarium decemcellulare]